MDLFGTAAHWFGRGGFVMYLLLLASIGAVSIIIERARYYAASASVFIFSYSSGARMPLSMMSRSLLCATAKVTVS